MFFGTVKGPVDLGFTHVDTKFVPNRGQNPYI